MSLRVDLGWNAAFGAVTGHLVFQTSFHISGTHKASAWNLSECLISMFMWKER